MKKAQKRKLNKILNVYIGIGVTLWIIAAVLIFTPIIPQIYYSINPEASANELSSLTQTVSAASDEDELAKIRDAYLQKIEEEKAYQESLLPPFDASLPKTNRIRIPQIGVDAEIQEGSDAEAELKKGPWIVDDFGRPNDQFAPIIMAAHRWGAIGWTAQERKVKSFLKLPDLRTGDIIEIIWEQRLYKYEIYSGEENTKITDYDADLIMYTCKLYWESPIRIFRYAKRIN